MPNPSGTNKTNRSYSEEIQEALHQIVKILSDSAEEKAIIYRDGMDVWITRGENGKDGEYRHIDGDYTLKEKERAIKRIEAAAHEQIKPHIQKYENVWKKIVSEYVIPKNGTANNKDLLTAMQLVLTSAGAMTQETLLNALKPIELDYTAIQTIYPLIEKTGLLHAFNGLRAHNILITGNRLKENMKEAQRLYDDIGSSYASYEEAPLKAPVMNNMLVESIKQAEQAYTELQELVSA